MDLEIIERTTTHRDLKCMCSNRIYEGSYGFHHEVSKKGLEKVTVTFYCPQCDNSWIYIGKNWNSLKVNSRGDKDD